MSAVIRSFPGLCLAIAILAAPVAMKAQGAPPQIAVADDPDARPPVTAIDLKILKRAGEILDSPAHWNRADNRNCLPGAKTFSLYCALEKATLESGQSFEHRGAALQEVRFVIDEVSAGKNYEYRLMDYNNDPATTLADIHKVLRLAEDLIALRLKMESRAPDVFIGNWSSTECWKNLSGTSDCVEFKLHIRNVGNGSVANLEGDGFQTMVRVKAKINLIHDGIEVVCSKDQGSVPPIKPGVVLFRLLLIDGEVKTEWLAIEPVTNKSEVQFSKTADSQ